MSDSRTLARTLGMRRGSIVVAVAAALTLGGCGPTTPEPAPGSASTPAPAPTSAPTSAASPTTGSASPSGAAPSSGAATQGCPVELPTEWTALFDQHRMAAPEQGITSVGVLEVGLDGQVVTEETAEIMDTRQVLLSTVDRGTSQPMDVVGGQAVLADFDTDGNAYLFTQAVMGVVSQRLLWAPGMSEPVLVDEPDTATASNADGLEYLHLQAQQNGYSIWLTPATSGELELMLRDAAGTEQRVPLPGVSPQNITGLATQSGNVWIAAAGQLHGFDLTSGAAVPFPVEVDGTVGQLFSDGLTLGLVDPAGVTIMTNDGEQTRLELDTAQTLLWSVSDGYVSWLQGSWPDAEYRLWDTTTGAVTTLPEPANKTGTGTGVHNGHLVIQDDPARPAVVPLDALDRIAGC